jgi:hypothetical protein
LRVANAGFDRGTRLAITSGEEMPRVLRIVLKEGPPETPVLDLEGQVVGPWVEELHRVCEPILARGAGLSLDLSSVSFISREGVALLRRLRDRQTRLVNCSRFVAEQLKAPGADRGGPPSGSSPGMEEER